MDMTGSQPERVPSQSPREALARPSRDVGRCPFVGCEARLVSLTRDSLVRHLSQTHLQNGATIPSDCLVALNAAVCPRCKQLFTASSTCAGCGRAPVQDPPDNSGDAPTFEPLVPAGPGLLSGFPVGTPLSAACPVVSAAIVELLARNVPTVRHLPSACQRLVAGALEGTIRDLLSSRTWESLYRFLGFAKLVLRAGTRTHRGTHRLVSAEIQRRLRLWNPDGVQLLIQELDSSCPPGQPKPAHTRARAAASASAAGSGETVDRATLGILRSLIEEGAPAKAARHLLSEGLADPGDPAVAAKLGSLHPQVPLPDCGRIPPTQPPDWLPTLSQDDVLEAITSFPPGSAAGPSGLRPVHLRDCVRRPGVSSGLLIALRDLAQGFLGGSFPEAVAPLLCASNLVPLRKKDGGVRPVAVGDTVRRLCGKILLRHSAVKREVSSLQPRQCGVGVQGACELVAMGLQSLASLAADQCWMAVQVDVANAFNTCSREAMLSSAALRTPSCLPWLKWCYSQACPLFCGGRVMAVSTTGVHQGDALGPLGFALALDHALCVCDSGNNPEWCSWYLDDGLLVGSPDSVCHLLQRLRPALADVGLHLNLGKCSAWGPGIFKEGEGGPHIQVQLPDDHPLRSIPVVPFGPSGGITVLGIPVSASTSGPWFAAKWSDACQRALSLLDRVRQVGDGQLQHTLIRYCADAAKVNHLLRATPFDTGELALAGLTDAIRKAVEEIVGAPLPAHAWGQATLPLAQGGLGVRDPLQVRPGARVATIVHFVSQGPGRVGVPSWAAVPPPDTPVVLASLQARLGRNHEPTAQWVSSPQLIATADSSYSRQSWWGDHLVAAARQSLSEAGSIRDRVRFISQSGELANAWLQASGAQSGLSDTDFRSLCRFWLGLPLLPGSSSPSPPRCPHCPELLDPFGDHLLSCKSNGIASRHNILRDAFAAVLTSAGIQHAREVMIPLGLGRNSPFARERPADLLLTGWDRGRDLAVDLTVTHPACPSLFPLACEKARRHLGQAESAKVTKQGQQCCNAGWAFHPAAFSPWGGMGPGAKSLVFEISKRACADLHGWPRSQRLREIRGALSLALARGVAAQLSSRLKVIVDADWEDALHNPRAS